MLHRLATILLLTVIALVCHAQEINESNFTRYTKLEGLSNNYITAIAQDSNGYIWIGTAKGLNRFDGKSFINIFKNQNNSPIPDNYILSLHTEKNNEIIGSTGGGAFSFNSVSHQHNSFVVASDPIIFFWSNQCWDMIKDKSGHYVMTTKTGLYVFDQHEKMICRYDRYTPDDVGRTQLWFGGWLQTLSNGTTFQENNYLGSLYDPYRGRIDTFFVLRKKKLKGILEDAKGDPRLSFAGSKDQIIIVNTTDNFITFYSLLSNDYFVSPVSASIIDDIDWQKPYHVSDSLIAINGKSGGFYLLHYNTAGKRAWFDNEKYFASRVCNSVFCDREKRLWIGTNDGLFRQNLRNNFFSADDISVQFPAVLNTAVKSVYTENDNLFLGLTNDGGLLELDKNTKKLKRFISLSQFGPEGGTIYFIFSYSRDTLLLGTGKGLVWLNKNNFQIGKYHGDGDPPWMDSARVRNFLEDSDGNLWFTFGRLNSVVMLDRATHRFTDISSPVNPLFKITLCFSMAEDKQRNIWLAGDGLCRWNRQKQKVDTLIPYPSIDQSSSNFMEILDRDENNNLWVVTSGNAIIQYNCTDKRMYLRLPENSMVDPGIITNSSIIHNTIWMGMLNGIGAFNIKDYSMRQFNYADGLPSAVATSIRKGSFYDRQDNRFYFGAGHYLISFVPDLSLSHILLPQVFLEFRGSNGKTITPGSKGIHLPYSQNDIEVRFNALNFTDPEENRFSYRIVSNSDSSWHDLYTQSSVALSNLSAGNHQIEVRLYSVNNRWPAQVKAINIYINPPFWQTTGFLIIAAITILSSLYFLYRYRINTIKKKANLDKQLTEFEMKALHAQMNPHFIFNCLNSIREMILNSDNQQASHYLSKFAHLIRITLNNSSKPFISLQNTIDYLRRYLEMERIRTTNFSYTIEVDKAIEPEDLFIPPMLIQPFIENAIWHGASIHNKPVKISICFSENNRRLLCKVEDNGIGIEASIKNKNDPGEIQHDHHSLGIGNVKERIRVLNEKYNLQSDVIIEDKSNLPGYIETGTIVTVYLPVKHTEA